MRAFVLVLLGGSLLWLVLKNFGSSHAADVEPTGDASGYLLPPESTDVSTVTAVEEQPPAPAPVTRSEPASRPLKSQGQVPAPATARSSEVELASQLLHRPQEVPQYLENHGRDTPLVRKNLALAFSFAILDQDLDAKRSAASLDSESDVKAAERGLLERALGHEHDGLVLAGPSRETPLLQAATMALLAKEGAWSSKAGQNQDSARIFSELLLEEIRAPWKADRGTLLSWTESLRRAQTGHRWNRSGDWPSVKVTVEKGDSLITLRKRVLAEHPSLTLCTGQLERANELHGGVLHPGQSLRVPTEQVHMVVDLDAHWAFYLMGDEVAAAWEIGIGKPGSETRPGVYTVGEKRTEPMWFQPGGSPIPYGDPKNPLGTRWIGWLTADSSNSGFGFHGTKEPESIGKDASDGCIRMHNRDVEELFEILPKGASIDVRP